jgi:hypothetical protein
MHYIRDVAAEGAKLCDVCNELILLHTSGNDLLGYR